jgi:hypothetical protein
MTQTIAVTEGKPTPKIGSRIELSKHQRRALIKQAAGDHEQLELLERLQRLEQTSF